MFTSIATGCTVNLPEKMKKHCEQNLGDCKTCSEPNCNSRLSFQKCLLCDSTKDQHCINNPELMETKVCKNYNDECFSSIGDRNFTRGCLKDQNYNFISNCRRNRNKCSICDTKTENACNDIQILMETCSECSSHDYGCVHQPSTFKGKICSDFSRPSIREGCYISEVSV